MLVLAGRTPVMEAGAHGARSLNIHWAQEMFDQGAMLREAAKWQYELRRPDQLEVVLDRALSIAATAPQAPVALLLPREVLAAPLDGLELADPSAQAPARLPAPDPALLAPLAEALLGAARPMIVTAAAGRDPAVPALLGALAEEFALRVVEFRPRHHSLANDHPMHGGFEVDPHLPESDALLVLDCDVPWIPAIRAPRADTRIFHAGTDPLFATYPVRSFRAEAALVADTAPLLRALAVALRAARSDPAALAARRSAMQARHVALREAAIAAAEAGGAAAPMSQAFVSRVLGTLLPDDAILVNEYPLVRGAMCLRAPGSFLGSSPVGSLGWGLPAALGAQMAAPGRLVVAALGDGSYIFSNPVACHQLAAAERLPVLSVVFDNAGYGAVKRATTAMYPQGAAVAAARMPLATLDPAPDHVRIVESCGGFGLRVDRPEQLAPALTTALRVVREEGRQALVSVRVA
jgi:acetolactate synthase-1/2/3 large subunit